MQTVQALDIPTLPSEVHVNATSRKPFFPAFVSSAFCPPSPAWYQAPRCSHSPGIPLFCLLTNAITTYPGLQAENNRRATGFFMSLYPLSLLHPTPHIALEVRKHLRSWDPDPPTRRDCQGAPDKMQEPNLALFSSDRTTSLCRGHREENEAQCLAAFLIHDSGEDIEKETPNAHTHQCPQTPHSNPTPGAQAQSPLP